MDNVNQSNRKRSRRILELSFSNNDPNPVTNVTTNICDSSQKSPSLYRKVFQRVPKATCEKISTSPSSGLTYQELTNVISPPYQRNKDVSSPNSHLLNYPHLPNIKGHGIDDSAQLLSSDATELEQSGLDLRTNTIKILEHIILPAPNNVKKCTPVSNDVPLKALNESKSEFGSLSNISVSNMIDTLDESFDEQRIAELLATPKSNKRNAIIEKQSTNSDIERPSEESQKIDSSIPTSSNSSKLQIQPNSAKKKDDVKLSIKSKENKQHPSLEITSKRINEVEINQDDNNMAQNKSISKPDSDDESYIPDSSLDSDSDITDMQSNSDCNEENFDLNNETENNDTEQIEEKNTEDEGWIEINDTVPDFEEYPHECKYNIPDNVETPDEMFRLFLTDEILDKMVLETNSYAENFVTGSDLKNKSRFKSWKPTDREEMLKFFGIILVMGLVKVPHINDYWAQNPMYRNEYIGEVMKRDRFLMILKFWHFSKQREGDGTDKLHKIRDVYEMLLAQFRKITVPGKILVIDESMVPWRGRLQFRQYIKNKSHKYGVKLYKLCTVDGFTFNMIVYTGKCENGREKDHGMKTVLRLIKDLEYKGRIVIADNFYNSVNMAEELLKKKTYLCGTLRSNRRGLPKCIVAKKIKKGEVIGKMTRKGVRVIKWMDKRQVLMISTCRNHDAKLETKTRIRRGREECIKKPGCIFSYNDSKKGIDYSDQMSSYYSTLKRGLKWFRKLMLELIFGTTLVNAWVVYNKKNKKYMPKKLFVETIIEKFTGVPFKNKKNATEVISEHKYTMNDKKRRCTGCYEKARQTMTSREADKKVKQIKGFCIGCNKFLCLTCFNEKH